MCRQTQIPLCGRELGQNPEPVFKIIMWKIPVVTTESTYLRVYSKVDSFHGYSALFMKRDGFPWIFQKVLTLYGNSYYEKEEGRPYSFSHVCVQKIQDMDTEVFVSQKITKPPKLCLWIRLKRVHSLTWLFPAFLCFEYREARTVLTFELLIGTEYTWYVAEEDKNII